MRKYNDRVEEQMATHCLQHRLDVCTEALHGYPGDPDKVSAMERIDIHFTDIQINAERRCRKIYRPALPFSEPLRLWDFRRKCYQGLLRRLYGKCASPSNILRRATAAQIPDPKALTAMQCNDGIRYCNLQIMELKKMPRGCVGCTIATVSYVRRTWETRRRPSELSRI